MNLCPYDVRPSTPCFTRVSRRTFFGVAAGAVAATLPLKSATAALGSFVASRCGHVDCVLLDCGACTLPESLDGYELALSAAGARFVRTGGSSVPRARTLIIPACIALRSVAAGTVATALEEGSCVVLESGAGFATSRDFSAHHSWLRSEWGLNVETPLDLWESPGSHRDPPAPCSRRGVRRLRSLCVTPYIDLHWPLRIKVRDFSRIVPLSAPSERVVGWCGGQPVACKQTVGKGTLVYLGSPLGPALRVEDTEAHRWLREVVGSLGWDQGREGM